MKNFKVFLVIFVLEISYLATVGSARSMAYFRLNLKKGADIFHASYLLAQDAAPTPPADTAPPDQTPPSDTPPPDQGTPAETPPDQTLQPDTQTEPAPDNSDSLGTGSEVVPNNPDTLETPQDNSQETVPEQINPSAETPQPELVAPENSDNGVQESVQGTTEQNENLPADVADKLTNTEGLTSRDSLTSPEDINNEIVQKSDLEENLLSQAPTIGEQENLLVQFSNEKVDDIENSVIAQDFSTVEFVTQRLNDQIDTFVENFSSLPPEEKLQLEEKFKKFSDEADTRLRSQQLVVPEGLEQDMEITRGKILSIDILP